MDFDLIVLGLGPGGEEVAGKVAEAGRPVLGVDPRLVGGECPYFGCIPSKMILRGADLLGETRRVDGVAGHATAEPDFTPVADRIRDEATDDWDDTVAVERFERQGGTFARAAGRLAGRDEQGRLRVRVGDDTHTAARVVVATGTAPAVPPIAGLAGLRASGDGVDGPVWTNREVVRTRNAPPSLIVLGGGAIGCELAQGFARFGSKVTVVEAAPHLLMPEEPEAGRVVADVFRREGITVHEGVGATEVTGGGDGVVVTLEDGTTVTGAKILVAAGRRPELADIGLDTIGLDPKARNLDVDDHMQVQSGGAPVDGLYAVGDITGRGAFTHVAVWQAKVLTEHLLGAEEQFGGYHGLAWATFTDPEVGRVGMSEMQARDAGLSVRTGVQPIASNSRGWIHGPGNDGFVKLVEDSDRGVLVGATVVGPYGGELLGLLTLAVHAEVPVSTLATMHYAFPTLHRAVLEAVGALSA
ncbi:MAG TPA: NAD(P)/FAD-dependent oxidoreductase [Jatrophihabitans sp.]|jgi:pyruvate/2-oxoglutarate dehydrogenase complex dihydrolipoamide dehydrogenase (E3) component|uniref:dihydrolipoyl dehydrogenase family protein n=1 Tax=Jatrophihabitans sp. TaxID=1932789 RepID=UPI002E01F567|nr:NAD(P)/FAD-dependent oxidoreductase [Jatrophihabitans sp.]